MTMGKGSIVNWAQLHQSYFSFVRKTLGLLKSFNTDIGSLVPCREQFIFFWQRILAPDLELTLILAVLHLTCQPKSMHSGGHRLTKPAEHHWQKAEMQAWGHQSRPSCPLLHLKILFIKFTNRKGYKWQRWRSTTPTQNVQDRNPRLQQAQDFRMEAPHKRPPETRSLAFSKSTNTHEPCSISVKVKRKSKALKCILQEHIVSVHRDCPQLPSDEVMLVTDNRSTKFCTLSS